MLKNISTGGAEDKKRKIKWVEIALGYGITENTQNINSNTNNTNITLKHKNIANKSQRHKHHT